MGDDASNPNNINTCIYLNPNNKLNLIESNYKITLIVITLYVLFWDY